MKLHLGRRKLRTYLAIAMVGAMLAVAQPLPAHAIGSTWSFTHGFEADNASIWIFASSPACGDCGYVSGPEVSSHSGTHVANMEAPAGSGNFSTVFTYLNLAPSAASILWCYAQAYVATNGLVNVEVIDSATWRYVALASISNTIDFDYHLVRTALWHPAVRDVVFRVSVVNNNKMGLALVDDVAVVCSV